MHEGSCHCGAITLTFTPTRLAAELPTRVCGCVFCTKHRPRYTSDPAGRLAFRAASNEALSRYRFGLALADFLICRTCGVFVGAFEPGDAVEDGSIEGRGVVNLEVLADAAAFVVPPTRFTGYDTEDAAARSTRRAKSWTPAALRVG